ncbi:hypothetical protein PPL_10437 [Heterostelium album PN500]|uniref:Trafficking protein particle complex subunit 6B n=1 Tax=Heterostelium pallidum (strain ATCC 26659 / Pp 5 / PN500) TaxID=670386 RepID=D3BR33_HETP5|nr:hypothetical protein PPL_10437 [Heterostelium album PN500]EFA75865.1 hypothetical protein PPL_10437 [Heterostelium album PN500]|eukprot:XP_020427999.1 hypothetical protein PPL_10437 [Heterostelium album PN500]
MSNNNNNNNNSPSNDSPLSVSSSVGLSTPGINVTSTSATPSFTGITASQISSSVGNPSISPLASFSQSLPTSLSAANSPLTNTMSSTYHHQAISTSNLASAINPTSNTTASSLSTASSALATANSAAAPTLPQKEISVSCFEFLYIEMIDYIVKSSRDKTQISKKLEKLGYKVGHKLVEKLTIEQQLLSEVLDVVKFICKVFWIAIFKKSIDSLRTNHKGVFVLTDQRFQWLLHLSFDPNSTTKDCSDYVYFAIGLIKGAMANFGYKSTITFEIQQIHSVVFTIKLET